MEMKKPSETAPISQIRKPKVRTLLSRDSTILISLVLKSNKTYLHNMHKTTVSYKHNLFKNSQKNKIE